MATPMYLIGTDKSHQESQIRPEPTKTRPKKNPAGKNPPQKKLPQRGLGVAQLERLRLQERWRKMTEMPPPPPPPFLLDPGLPNFPVQFTGAGQAVVGNDGGGSVLPGFDCHQGFVVQRIGSNNGGFISGGLMGMEAYAHGGGAVDPRAFIGNGFEASRELSSIPKFPPPPPPCVSDRCDICFKKKRVNLNNKNPIAGAETASFDFLGLSTNSSAIASNHNTDLGLSFNFNFNPPQGGAEIKQIHRRVAEKGGVGDEEGSSSSSSSILMEYEFFPGKNGRGTEFENLKMPKEELQYGGEEEGSSCITTSYSTTDHNIINGGMISTAAHLDLSLKLSF